MHHTPHIGMLISHITKNVSYTEEVVGSSPIPPTNNDIIHCKNRLINRFFRCFSLIEVNSTHYLLHPQDPWVIGVQSFRGRQ
jgi:hypothetical protein